MKVEETGLTIPRFINASRAMVWKAWSRPEHLARWWIPAPIECKHEEMGFHEGWGTALDQLAAFVVRLT